VTLLRHRWPPRAPSWRTVALAALILVTLVASVATAAARGWLGRSESTAPPPEEGWFDLRPVGSFDSLPSDVEAAAAVHRSTWEPRPENGDANRTVPTRLALAPKRDADRAYDPRWNPHILERISGDFAGTTDEIFQWAAVKWGLSDNVLRTLALQESEWWQSNSGDYVDDAAECPPGLAPPCPVTYGIVGVRSTSWQGIYPWNKNSTAAAVDVLGGWLRGCYEGWVWWLRDHGNHSRGTYRAGDLWGCVGAWFSGDWHDGRVGRSSGENYIHRAQDACAQRPWLRSGF
jgi:hypothetical protein